MGRDTYSVTCALLALVGMAWLARVILMFLRGHLRP